MVSLLHAWKQSFSGYPVVGRLSTLWYNKCVKVCGKCKESLPLSSFRFKNKERGTYQSYCIECNKVKNKEHYQANKTSYKEKSRVYREINPRKPSRQELYLFKFKSENPCVDCGESDPIVLGFDHRDPKEKLFNIGSHRNKFSLEDLKLEIKKCDIRCHNCHARRTAKQFGWYKLYGPLE